MKILLISGLCRPHKDIDYLRGTLFDHHSAPLLARTYFQRDGLGFDLGDLVVRCGDRSVPLLVPVADTVPHLTTCTLQAILREAGFEHDILPLEKVWEDNWGDGYDCADVVAISTTFICNAMTLDFVIRRVSERMPRTPIILGGQYSNLKYRKILRQHSNVSYIVTGDAEDALPMLLNALRSAQRVDDIPNLATRDPSGEVRWTGFTYVDIDACPSASFEGECRTVPYESMRGCPFTCRFCSYPHASPKWRYKSAAKIRDDWRGYRDCNGTSHVKSMDSTFTVPNARMRELLELLPEIGIGWEAYSRADVIRNQQTIDAYERAGCRELSIGFESMSDVVLGYMNKKVKAEHNRRAAALLVRSQIKLRVCIMVGYPGETPEEYEKTHRYLVDEFEARCMLSPFSFIDETMPVWEDLERFDVRFDKQDDPLYGWSHSGMDIDDARRLVETTLDDLRWKNERGVMLLWQYDYRLPLVPHLSNFANQRVEKLIERLAFLPRDFPNPEHGHLIMGEILEELEKFDISLSPASERCSGRINLPSSIWIDFI